MKLLTTIAALLLSFTSFSQDYVEYDNGIFTQNGEELSMEQVKDLMVLHKAGRGNVRRANRFISFHKNQNYRIANNIGSLAVRGHASLPPAWPKSLMPIWPILHRSTLMTCRCSRRSRPSPSASTAPTRFWPTRKSATSCGSGKIRVMAICLSAWQRRNTASAPTRTCAARRPDIRCRFVRSGCQPGPASSSPSAARS